MKLVIKLADVTDFSLLTRFLEENNIPSITRLFNPFPLTKKIASDICHKHHKDLFYVAYKEQIMVGLAMLRGWEEGYQIPSFGILVDHRYHHQGIGRQITTYVIEDAKRKGYEKIRLSVFASNSNAVSLYLSLGFYEVGRELIVIGKETDIKVIMIKELQLA